MRPAPWVCDKYYSGANLLVIVQRADDSGVCIDDQQRRDAIRLHQMHGLGREHAGIDGLRAPRHDRVHAGGVQIGGALDRAAQIAIGEDADHATLRVDDRSHPEALATYLEQTLGERRRRTHLRHVRTRPHDVADVQQQTPAEIAGRMRAGEILFREAARLEQRHAERVADRQGCGRACGRR